ncbi:MAG: TolC family protein [Betaproteobacteria bacterium]|nr:TolC family protein [Betaproteobacteria bacterium]
MRTIRRCLIYLTGAVLIVSGQIGSCHAQSAAGAKARSESSINPLSPESEARITDVVRNTAAQGPGGAQPILAGRNVAPLTYREAMQLGLRRNPGLQFQKQVSAETEALALATQAAFDPVTSVGASYARGVTRDRPELITRTRRQEPDFDAFQKAFERALQNGTTTPGQQISTCNLSVDGQPVAGVAEGNPTCTPTVSSAVEFASFRGRRPDETIGFFAQAAKPLEYGASLSLAFQTSYRPRQSPFVTLSATDFAFVPPNLAYTSTLSMGFATSLPFGRNFGPYGTQQATDVKLGQLRVARSGFEFGAVTESTLLAVDNAYWDLVGSLRVLQIALEQKAILEQLRKRAQSSYKLGEVNEYSMNQIDARLANTLGREALAWNGLASASEALSNLLDGDVQDLLLPVAYQQSLEQAPSVDLNAAMRNAMERNADVKRTEALLEESRITLNHRANDVKPDVLLNASVSFGQSNSVFGYPNFGNSIGNIFNPDVRTAVLGVTVRIPIGNEALKAALSQARVGVMQARDQLAQTRNQAVQQLTASIDALQSAQKQIEISRVNMNLAEDAFQAATRRRALNLVTEFMLLEIQNDLLQAQLNHADALVQYRKNVARFLAAQNLLSASVNE